MQAVNIRGGLREEWNNLGIGESKLVDPSDLVQKYCRDEGRGAGMGACVELAVHARFCGGSRRKLPSL